MKQITTLLMITSFFVFSACNEIGEKSEEEKIIHNLGHDMGTKLKLMQLSRKELSILKKGIDDGVSGKKPPMEKREFISKLGGFFQARQKSFSEKEKKESERILEEASKKENAEKLESGVVYVSIKEGTGDSPQDEDSVKVHYHGTLRNGEVFDSSKERGQPATFQLNRVIKCWGQGVKKMKVGGMAELYCPSDTAYGDRGSPPKVPPGALLKFEVELLEIVKEDGKGTSSSKKQKKNKSKEKKKEKKKKSDK